MFWGAGGGSFMLQSTERGLMGFWLQYLERPPGEKKHAAKLQFWCPVLIIPPERLSGKGGWREGGIWLPTLNCFFFLKTSWTTFWLCKVRGQVELWVAACVAAVSNEILILRGATVLLFFWLCCHPVHSSEGSRRLSYRLPQHVDHRPLAPPVFVLFNKPPHRSPALMPSPRSATHSFYLSCSPPTEGDTVDSKGLINRTSALHPLTHMHTHTEHQVLL